MTGRHRQADGIVVVEIFQNSLCHASGFGEGASLLGVEFLTLDENGDFPSTLLSDLSALDTFDPGDIITATVTLPDTFTTEFSNCAVATGGDQTHRPRGLSMRP